MIIMMWSERFCHTASKSQASKNKKQNIQHKREKCYISTCDIRQRYFVVKFADVKRITMYIIRLNGFGFEFGFGFVCVCVCSLSYCFFQYENSMVFAQACSIPNLSTDSRAQPIESTTILISINRSPITLHIKGWKCNFICKQMNWISNNQCVQCTHWWAWLDEISDKNGIECMIWFTGVHCIRFNSFKIVRSRRIRASVSMRERDRKRVRKTTRCEPCCVISSHWNDVKIMKFQCDNVKALRQQTNIWAER